MGLLSKASELVNEYYRCPPSLRTVKKNIAEFYLQYASFNGIVFEPSAELCIKLASVIGSAGIALPLPNGYPLVLLPARLDRELIAARLSKTLNIKVAFLFMADSVENALLKINSFTSQ